MKKILGLNITTKSIGWAFVEDSDDSLEEPKIIKAGVRVTPIKLDEVIEFMSGDRATINADRTMRRTMRINHHRYKLRRQTLINTLKKIGFIDNNTILSEGKTQTHETYKLRAEATFKRVSKEELARVLLMINKKRGYKSRRKESNSIDGQLFDEIEVAELLHSENITPGQLSFELLQDGKTKLPKFYLSDLENEFDTIWKYQSQFYGDIFTDENKKIVRKLNKNGARNFFRKALGISPLQRKIKNAKLEQSELRTSALSKELELSELAYILIDLNSSINKSSKYLHDISDRSKTLAISKITVGQYLFNRLKENFNNSLKNILFNRSDHINEFNIIWKEQSKYYSELTDELRDKIRDVVIFYQRPLKSRKGLISKCELEGQLKTFKTNGVSKTKLIGPRAAPFSSPAYQEIAVWRQINAIRIYNKDESKKNFTFEHEIKERLYHELSTREYLTGEDFLTWIFRIYEIPKRGYKVNFERITGNHTQVLLYKAFYKICDFEGYVGIEKNKNAIEIKRDVRDCFKTIGIDISILELDMFVRGENFAKQKAYEFWHLLYSYESDTSTTGTKSLFEILNNKYGFKKEHSEILNKINFEKKYTKFSVKALRKVYPFLIDGSGFEKACISAGYEMNKLLKDTPLNDQIKELKKKAVNSPTVLKVLNQTISVVNQIIEHPDMGRPDQIHFELSPELKRDIKNRKKNSLSSKKINSINKSYRIQIASKFDLSYVSRRELVKYKLYLELKEIGYRTLASSTYIEESELFTDDIQIVNIISKNLLFDNSFTNKTLEHKSVISELGNTTIRDYCQYQGRLESYESDVNKISSQGVITYSKERRLLMSRKDIYKSPIEKELNLSGHISTKTTEILGEVCHNIHATSNSITSKLRSDWKLNTMLRELNWTKFENAGLTYFENDSRDTSIPQIRDWSKVSDYRQRTIDAIVIAFTKPEYINRLKHLHLETENDWHKINSLVSKDVERINDVNFLEPYPQFKDKVEEQVEVIFTSYKHRKRVLTNSYNKTQKKGKGNFGYFLERTPRGSLHTDNKYKKTIFYNVKDLNMKRGLTVEKISSVTNPKFKKALYQRLENYDFDIKKAFTGKNSYANNPVMIGKTPIPSIIKIKVPEVKYTLRIDITPKLNLEEVYDKGIQKILINRLEEFDGNAEKAFVDLETNPIWVNEQRGLSVKGVNVVRLNTAFAIHNAKDHNGELIKIDKGKLLPNDFVSSYNNHHTALYLDDNNVIHEELVSFFEVVRRQLDQKPIIKKEHEMGWEFLFSIAHNELFFYPSEEIDLSIEQILNSQYRKQVSTRLFRVQKIAYRNYFFRHHIDNSAIMTKETRGIRWESLRGVKSLEKLIKIRVSSLGEIISVGEN